MTALRDERLAQAGAGRQRRRRASSDGFDDLAVVDPLQVDGGDAEVRVTELTLDHVERHAFAAISTACAWRSWCGGSRWRTPARTARLRSVARAAAGDQGRPRVGPSMTHSSAPIGSDTRA